MLVSKRHDGREIRRTATGDQVATWEIRKGIPHILFINDNRTSTPAYRWPDLPMPNCRAGHVAFGPEDDNYPTLAEAIVRLPQYETTLWEHVRSEYRAALLEKQRIPGCTEGRTFSPAEQAAWERSIKRG